MVLNFFQLKNLTADFSFDIVNSENSRDNYTVGPRNSTARHDAWLAQGNGSKGISINASSAGSSVFKLLHMWDQDHSIRYRIGVEERRIAVNGNKDFWIEVHDSSLVFNCHNGSFSANEHQVTVSNWKDLITNDFSEDVRDSGTLQYAHKFWGPSTNLDKRAAHISRPNEREAQEISDLIAQWDMDYLEHGRRQSTLITGSNGWRIDLQDNGAVQRNGMFFYNIAVQRGGGNDNVFAHILLPVGYVIGRRRIRNALLESSHHQQVTTLLPPQHARLPLYTSTQARESWAVRSLMWMLLVGASQVKR